MISRLWVRPEYPHFLTRDEEGHIVKRPESRTATTQMPVLTGPAPCAVSERAIPATSKAGTEPFAKECHLIASPQFMITEIPETDNAAIRLDCKT
jgi:hypothetical protein